MKLLLFIFSLSVFASHTQTIMPNQYIVKGAELIVGKKLRDLGRNVFLIETAQKIKVDNKNVFYNFQYTGEFKETKVDDKNNDALLNDQKHHLMIKSAEAWKITKGSRKIVVAITDNEFEMDHDDLKKSWWKNEKEIPGNGIDDDLNGYIDDVNGWDFVTQDNNPDVEEGPTHGTHVSGIIAASLNNKIGVAGIAPNVSIMPLRWYGDERRWDTALVVETYRYAIENGANIINTSYNIDPLVDDPAYLDVIQYAKENEVIVFNSAGNDNKKDPPRSVIKDIVLVCSVRSSKERHFDKKSRFSNYGSEIDVCAPGDPILSTVQRRYLGESRYGELEGTSMSSPVAAAVAALIWSHNPEFKASEVVRKLIDSADNIDDKNKQRYKGMLGSGRVNALEALR